MTATMDLISEQVLTSAVSSVTFSSIPQGFKDLVLEMTTINSATNSGGMRLQVNNDTSTNYSETQIWGTGSSALSARALNFSYIDSGYSTTIQPYISVMQLFSYSNTNMFKTMLFRGSASDTEVALRVGLWRSTSAITSIQMSIQTVNWAAGSTFRLFGIVG